MSFIRSFGGRRRRAGCRRTEVSRPRQRDHRSSRCGATTTSPFSRETTTETRRPWIVGRRQLGLRGGDAELGTAARDEHEAVDDVLEVRGRDLGVVVAELLELGRRRAPLLTRRLRPALRTDEMVAVRRSCGPQSAVGRRPHRGVPRRRREPRGARSSSRRSRRRSAPAVGAPAAVVARPVRPGRQSVRCVVVRRRRRPRLPAVAPPRQRGVPDAVGVVEVVCVVARAPRGSTTTTVSLETGVVVVVRRPALRGRQQQRFEARPAAVRLFCRSTSSIRRLAPLVLLLLLLLRHRGVSPLFGGEGRREGGTLEADEVRDAGARGGIAGDVDGARVAVAPDGEHVPRRGPLRRPDGGLPLLLGGSQEPAPRAGIEARKPLEGKSAAEPGGDARAQQRRLHHDRPAAAEGVLDDDDVAVTLKEVVVVVVVVFKVTNGPHGECRRERRLERRLGGLRIGAVVARDAVRAVAERIARRVDAHGAHVVVEPRVHDDSRVVATGSFAAGTPPSRWTCSSSLRFLPWRRRVVRSCSKPVMIAFFGEDLAHALLDGARVVERRLVRGGPDDARPAERGGRRQVFVERGHEGREPGPSEPQLVLERAEGVGAELAEPDQDARRRAQVQIEPHRGAQRAARRPAETIDLEAAAHLAPLVEPERAELPREDRLQAGRAAHEDPELVPGFDRIRTRTAARSRQQHLLVQAEARGLGAAFSLGAGAGRQQGPALGGHPDGEDARRREQHLDDGHSLKGLRRLLLRSEARGRLPQPSRERHTPGVTMYIHGTLADKTRCPWHTH
mmetsp:Transcript_14652/g.58579  ORF Transcript_14652/g.58579 Transcript_14652/m.58579 type:complete len:789 (+) Transcript_14652:135-2501(+)